MPSLYQVDTVKRLVIRKLPKILAIQLKRFDYDWERYVILPLIQTSSGPIVAGTYEKLWNQMTIWLGWSLANCLLVSIISPCILFSHFLLQIFVKHGKGLFVYPTQPIYMKYLKPYCWILFLKGFVEESAFYLKRFSNFLLPFMKDCVSQSLNNLICHV